MPARTSGFAALIRVKLETKLSLEPTNQIDKSLSSNALVFANKELSIIVAA